MLLFEHDLVQKVKQRSTSNSSETLMWRISLQNYKQYWQLLQSYRGSLTMSYLKVQKGHTKVNVELVRDFYVENIHVKLQHDTGNLRKVITFTRSSLMLPA